MGRHDWYRRTTWTEEDRKAFHDRFERSRGVEDRAQYLLIQAGSLLSADASEFAHAALGLTDRMIAEYPVQFFLSRAYHNRARCLVALGRDDEAIASYRNSLAARRAHPGIQNLGYLDFARLILDRSRYDLYDEALEVIDEFAGTADILPLWAYRTAAARALIWAAKQDPKRAAAFARQALAAAGAKESPFRYHRAIGLVENPEESLHTTLLEAGLTCR